MNVGRGARAQAGDTSFTDFTALAGIASSGDNRIRLAQAIQDEVLAAQATGQPA